MKLADAFVEIKGDKGKFSKTISAAKRETDGFAKSATKNLKRISIGLSLIATAAIAAAVAIGVKLTQAIIRAGKSVVQTALKYDKLKRGLTAVVGSAEEAERQLVRLRKAAELPGLSFPQAIQGSINLQAAGLSAELSERALKAFGNALVTVGKGAEDLAGVNLALTQIANKTSGFGQDVRQLQERLPQMQTALKNAFNGKPVEDLNITGKELVRALVIEFEKLTLASDGPANKIVNLGQAYEQLKATVGATMLDIVGTSADSMKKIIEDITRVLPHWKLYQDIVGDVFHNVAVIGIKMTGSLMSSMLKIVGAFGEVIWQPLLHGFAATLKNIDEWLGKKSVDLVSKLPDWMGATDEWAAGVKRNIDEIGAEWDKNNKIILDAKIEDKMENFLNKLVKEVPNMSATWTQGLIDIQAQIDRVVKRVEEGTVTTKKFSNAAKDLQITFSQFQNISDMMPTAADMKLAFGPLKDFGAAIADGFNMGGQASDTWKETVTRNLEEAREKALDAVMTISPALENMFAGFFSGNTKSLWTQFWADLKRIAIRQMATIFATQILTGLVTGGASVGAMGLGSALSALAPQSISAPSRAFGGAIRGGARAVGGFLEGGTVNIYDQDLRNLDQQRLTKQVEQGMGPAFARAAADGITS
jgi:hypothetical protein